MYTHNCPHHTNGVVEQHNGSVVEAHSSLLAEEEPHSVGGGGEVLVTQADTLKHGVRVVDKVPHQEVEVGSQEPRPVEEVGEALVAGKSLSSFDAGNNQMSCLYRGLSTAEFLTHFPCRKSSFACHMTTTAAPAVSSPTTPLTVLGGGGGG